MATPNIYIPACEPSSITERGYQTVEHVTLNWHMADDTLDLGRWRTLRTADGIEFQSRTVKARDAYGRTVDLVLFRDVPRSAP